MKMENDNLVKAFIWEEELEERYLLASLRIQEVEKESLQQKEFEAYFKKSASFLKEMTEVFEFVKSGSLYTASMRELEEHNRKLYSDILPDRYDVSYANPTYAVSRLGNEFGQLLSFLYTEMRSLIIYAYEQDLHEMVIRMELFLEIYGNFINADIEKNNIPEYETIRQVIYWFVMDYSETESEKRLAEQLKPEKDFAIRIIMNSDLNDLRFLYYFGEYVSDSEIQTAEYLNKLPQDDINRLAFTYTEGYRIGFETGGKDITKKKTVNIRYKLGFERVIRQAVLNFEKIGMKSVIYRAGVSIFQGKSIQKNGYFGAVANKQYEFDHKDDQSLYLDKQHVSRKLEVLRAAFETWKTEAGVHGGPAVLEVFGETPFSPETKKEACHLSDRQQKLSVGFASEYGRLQNEYIKGEERSFTIIAFPIPAIGTYFEKIFDETVKINTLDYKLYQGIQQTIIDALDKAEYVLIKGTGINRTDLKVKLHTLNNPLKETNFENCVADVNIPVGEVFTSPVLAETNGILHVSRVFLGELEYKNLMLTFKDGMVKEYSCTNFEKEEDNKKFMKENVLFHHDTLPLGEFAIGTNTTAYVMAQKYEIGDKLPILIAEKMGPHFAVGDTCYSHEEDMITYNPDGKAIIARENELSALRSTDISKAYFNCHTDITIPYDELGEVSAITGEGQTITIIRNGRFVLDGCEELNRPFEAPEK